MKRNWWVWASLIAIFVLALGLGAYFNAQEALSLQSFVGSDPWYHERVVRVAQGGHFLLSDPMLNYPVGFNNPRPPLFDLLLAVVAALLTPFLGAEAARFGTMTFAPAVFGALLVFPLYLLGKELWGRRSGVLAALFLALTPIFIQGIGAGDCDHDPMALLLAVTAFLFFVRALKASRTSARGEMRWSAEKKRGPEEKGNAEERWNLGVLRDDLRHIDIATKQALLTGVTLGILALVWKGFLYVLGIIVLYGIVQLVIDKIRRRHTALEPTCVSVLLPIAICAPYYLWAGLAPWLEVALLLVGGLLVMVALFHLARKLPAILTFPLIVVIAMAAVLGVRLLLPGLWSNLMMSMSSFIKTPLYQTIAEQQPPTFSELGVSFGLLTFYLAFFGLARLFYPYAKREEYIFVICWSVTAICMMCISARFMFNAAPIFALLAGWTTWWILKKVDFREMARSLRGIRGSVWHTLKKGVKIRHIGGILFVVALLVPNFYLSYDASTPYEIDPDGGMGLAFQSPYWTQGLQWLRTDAVAKFNEPTRWEERPGVIAWWDYGFEIIEGGEHPAMADPFQNAYYPAGKFITAQNETAAIQIMAARGLDAVGDQEATQLIVDALGVSEEEADRMLGELRGYDYVPLNDEDSVKLLRAVQRHTGKELQYFIADDALLLGKFSATVTLSGQQEEMFFEPIYLVADSRGGPVGKGLYMGSELDRLPPEMKETIAISRWVGDPQLGAYNVISPIQYKESYLNSMLYKAFCGYHEPNPSYDLQSALMYVQGNPMFGIPQDLPQAYACSVQYLMPGMTASTPPMPARDLRHFRLVYMNPGLRILRYYEGANVTGKVEGVSPEGVTVVVYDDYCPEDSSYEGIPHDSTTVDEEGRYHLIAPFGNVTVRVFRGVNEEGQPVEIGRSAVVPITPEQAMREGDYNLTADIKVGPGSIEGIVYWDRDNDGAYSDKDTAIQDANVTLVGPTGEAKDTTTGREGRYKIDGILPGGSTINVTAPGYRDHERRLGVGSSERKTYDVPMALALVKVSGHTVWKGEPMANVTVKFENKDDPRMSTKAVSNESGEWALDLRPAYIENDAWTDHTTYEVSVSYTATEEGGEVTYTYEGDLELRVGEETRTYDIHLSLV